MDWCRSTKKLRRTRVDIIGSQYNITPEIQEIFTNTRGASLQKSINEDKVIFQNILKCVSYSDFTPKRGETSSATNYFGYSLDNDVKKF